MKRTQKARNYTGRHVISLADAKSQVGSGWAGLIEKIWDKLPHDAMVTQVKEKYGTLRFYADYIDEETQDFIFEVEHESAHICEWCGKPGKTRTDVGWYLTLCEEHYVERTNDIIRREYINGQQGQNH